ncbi:DNA endonuclease SmrA [Alteromonas sp. ASW11-130]|uniref:DNA endonuclease SmrA n=1 Tax=Alteromonas sp. ASW11-130 TaxID=3015775 RepID=UPI00224212A1|nr:DNA endonuclease SmrA [Alteromonas sp. ASW11-130]MCW8091826.1 DNA endonuclease SmrA [Alteromonas sp. ASW11-130]
MSTSNHNDLSFFEAFSDVRPLAGDDKINLHSPEKSLAEKANKLVNDHTNQTTSANPLSLEAVEPVSPDDFIAYQQPGIQDGVFKNLRLGKYVIDYRLSLKGLTLKQSRDQLYQTVVSCHEKGVRAILIQHGKGEQSKPFPGLKKSYLNRWLRDLEEVIAFHTAQPMHGGLGATYALLKKHPDQKLINRERNRRR